MPLPTVCDVGRDLGHLVERDRGAGIERIRRRLHHDLLGEGDGLDDSVHPHHERDAARDHGPYRLAREGHEVGVEGAVVQLDQAVDVRVAGVDESLRASGVEGLAAGDRVGADTQRAFGLARLGAGLAFLRHSAEVGDAADRRVAVDRHQRLELQVGPGLPGHRGNLRNDVQIRVPDEEAEAGAAHVEIARQFRQPMQGHDEALAIHRVGEQALDPVVDAVARGVHELGAVDQIIRVREHGTDRRRSAAVGIRHD